MYNVYVHCTSFLSFYHYLINYNTKKNDVCPSVWSLRSWKQLNRSIGLYSPGNIATDPAVVLRLPTDPKKGKNHPLIFILVFKNKSKYEKWGNSKRNMGWIIIFYIYGKIKTNTRKKSITNLSFPFGSILTMALWLRCILVK